MPQYGEPNVGFLPEALAAPRRDRARRHDPQAADQHREDRARQGRSSARAGWAASRATTSAASPNTGTRGPDLATINQRVRYEWYDRWMHQPLRMAPGTRMPQAFVDGKSTLTTVLERRPGRPGRGDVGVPVARPGAAAAGGTGAAEGAHRRGEGPARGAPHVHARRRERRRSRSATPAACRVAFSADQCRLAYAWAGNFLDASPVWNNRGGSAGEAARAEVLDRPAGHPWGLTANPRIPPDFLARANNPAFGMPLPPRTGPHLRRPDGGAVRRLHARQGRPADVPLLARRGRKDAVLEGGRDAVAAEGHRPRPGFARQFAVEVPGGLHGVAPGGPGERRTRACVARRGPVRAGARPEGRRAARAGRGRAGRASARTATGRWCWRRSARRPGRRGGSCRSPAAGGSRCCGCPNRRTAGRASFDARTSGRCRRTTMRLLKGLVGEVTHPSS